MGRRFVVAALFAGLFGVGVFWAVDAAELVVTGGVGGSEAAYGLLFDTHAWMIFAAPFLGVLAAGFTKRQDPEVKGDKVLRHDGAAILEHWTHGVGTAVLLVSGIVLGFLMVPRLVSGIENVGIAMNIHFVAAVLFLFGTFYYAANTLMAMHRFKEHLPTRNAFDYTKRHYGRLLGFKRFSFPPETKYFESEKMAYVMAIASSAVIILTGLLKVAAHVVDMPSAFMAFVTPVHDIATIAMLAFFVAHVLFAAVLPMSWPVLRSMFTGHVSLHHVQEEHAGWLEELGHSSSPEPDAKKGA